MGFTVKPLCSWEIFDQSFSSVFSNNQSEKRHVMVENKLNMRHNISLESNNVAVSNIQIYKYIYIDIHKMS